MWKRKNGYGLLKNVINGYFNNSYHETIGVCRVGHIGLLGLVRTGKYLCSYRLTKKSSL